MAGGTAPGTTLDRDEALTRDRTERKFTVSRRDARALAAELDRHLAAHVHTDGTREPLPGTHYYTTTIYFDTPSRDVFAAATSGESHLKLRAREYYQFDPSFTQLATDPSQLVRYDPDVWLEIKMRSLHQVNKERIRVPKREVPAFFRDGLISSTMVELQRPAFGGDAQRALQEIANVCRQFDESLRACCVVNYRRAAWQDRHSTLRITLDRDVAFYAPPDDLWERHTALTRDALGTPVRALDAHILEVKALGSLPAWLGTLLEGGSTLGATLSKFVLATQALDG